MKIEYSAFIISKEGSNIINCEDSFSINVQKSLFSIADGVSQSLLPSIWSKLLTSSYAKGKISFEETLNSTKFIPLYDLTEEYKKQFQEKYVSLNKRQKFALDIRKNTTNYAASTFVGLEIHDKVATVNCIGDSVLFVYKEKEKELAHCCSMDRDGVLQFDNSPEYITSDGTVNGNIKHVSFELENGFIFLMTDALADWFNSLEDNEIKATIDSFSSLESHRSFRELVEQLWRSKMAKEDDMTLLVLHIMESQSPNVEYVEKHVDNITEISIMDYQENIKSLQNTNDRLSETNNQLKCQLALFEAENSRLKDSISRLKNAITDIKGILTRL